MADLRIAHLYAQFLNIYGDRGNIITLIQRARWRGIEATTQAIGIGEEVDPDRFDIYFIGGGQDKQQQTIAEDLAKQAKLIKQAVDSGAVVLAVCGRDINFWGTTTSRMRDLSSKEYRSSTLTRSRATAA